MLKPVAPCKDCDKRCLGCHDRCQAYIDFKFANNQYTKFIRHQKQSMYDMDDVEKKRFEKYNKTKTLNRKKGAYK